MPTVKDIKKKKDCDWLDFFMNMPDFQSELAALRPNVSDPNSTEESCIGVVQASDGNYVYYPGIPSGNQCAVVGSADKVATIHTHHANDPSSPDVFSILDMLQLRNDMKARNDAGNDDEIMTYFLITQAGTYAMRANFSKLDNQWNIVDNSPGRYEQIAELEYFTMLCNQSSSLCDHEIGMMHLINTHFKNGITIFKADVVGNQDNASSMITGWNEMEYSVVNNVVTIDYKKCK